MKTIEDTLGKYKPSAHVIALVVIALVGSFHSNAEFHDAVVKFWSGLPVLVRGPIAALVPIALQYWRSQTGQNLTDSPEK